MNKRIIFFSAAAALLLMASGCAKPAAKFDQRSAPVEPKGPVMNSFGVSQTPVPTPPPPVTPPPAPASVGTSTPATSTAPAAGAADPTSKNIPSPLPPLIR